MKIKVVVDVEKGVIQVQNRLGVAIEVLPLNVVNMLQRVIEIKDACVDILGRNFNRIQLE
jgi:hypothetical protein